MRRTLSVIAVPATLVLLLGCSMLGGEEQEPAPSTAPTAEQEQTESTNDAPEDPEESSEVEEPGESERPGAEDADGEPSSESGSPAVSDGLGEVTAIEHLWVDDSWTITEEQQDLCEMGGATPSIFSDQEGYFSCGPTASNALACSVDDGDEVVCIVNATDKQAIRFSSPTIAADGPPTGEPSQGPVPLTVTLSDGAVCSTVAHDQEQHWEGKFSWYRCDDGSELLTDETMEGTFETGETWTVQRSVDKQAPEETTVATVVYAGR